MKKVLKIIGLCLLTCCAIALVVCLLVQPTETKYFLNDLFYYLDTPIALCGISVTLGGVLLYFIVRYTLNNTSVGKKHLQQLQEQIDLEKLKNAKLSEQKDKVISKLENKVDEYKNEYAQKYEHLESAVKLIPNKKVQEALNNDKEQEND